jgi:predicted aldo/keto reductase-like oxidoreductase
MERRKLGKTGESLSVLGFGGILVMKEEQAHANRLVAEAVDRDINYFDVAPTYGNAEDRLGPALKPYRNNVFLACKTVLRTAKDAENQLHESLRKMKTDYFDLYQFHGFPNLDEAKQALGPGGALETFLKAREKGLIRYIGFSVHDIEAGLYAINQFPFDTILFPCNFVLYYAGNFGPQLKEAAVNKEMGLLALKSMAKTHWPKEPEKKPESKCWYEPIADPELAKLAIRFTLSEPVTAILSPGEERYFRVALGYLEKGFSPLTEEERKLLKTKATQLEPIFKEKKAS